MSDILERSFETAGLDEQRRTRYALGVLFSRETATPLGWLFRYWNDARRGFEELPQVEGFSPRRVLPEAVGTYVSWIDTSPEDPRTYVMRDHVASTIPGYGVELSGQPLEALPSPLHAQACMFEYLCCKHRREPMLHEIEQVVDGVARHYLRLLVPVVDDGDAVTRVYYAVRNLRTPVRIAASAPRAR